MAPIVRKAEEENVLYCLETECSTMTGTCEETARVIDALGGSEVLGSAWDVNNGWGGGELPYPDGYSHIRGRVYHVHVKPNAANNIDTVSSTDLTYDEVLRVLKSDGYDGAASIEHWGSPELMLEGVRQLVPLLDRVNG